MKDVVFRIERDVVLQAGGGKAGEAFLADLAESVEGNEGGLQAGARGDEVVEQVGHPHGVFRGNTGQAGDIPVEYDEWSFELPQLFEGGGGWAVESEDESIDIAAFFMRVWLEIR